MSTKKSPLLMDVHGAVEFIGGTESSLRKLVERRRIPFRRSGRRIYFVRNELERWVDSLPGVTLDEVCCDDE